MLLSLESRVRGAGTCLPSEVSQPRWIGSKSGSTGCSVSPVHSPKWSMKPFRTRSRRAAFATLVDAIMRSCWVGALGGVSTGWLGPFLDHGPLLSPSPPEAPLLFQSISLTSARNGSHCEQKPPQPRLTPTTTQVDTNQPISAFARKSKHRFLPQQTETINIFRDFGLASWPYNGPWHR